MSDITEIKRRLHDRVQSVVEHLLPNGQREGHEWCVGSTAGERGKSLKVHLTGQKAGLWSDFATGGGGDLIDLWREVRGVDLLKTLDEARDWLGMQRPEFHRPVERRQYRRPPKPQCNTPRGSVLSYLVEARNIPFEIIERYKIGEQGRNIIFPFLLPDGTLPLAKFRAAEDGARPQPTSSGCEPVLFGWQAIPPDAREVILTEGEIDALSWAAYGWPAMSLPFGGGSGNKQQWIENEFDRMARFERIYLATDMDEEGNKAAEEIANRLGRHRCLRVTMPFKDGNECRIEGVPRDVMAKCITDAAHLDPETLRFPSWYAANVISLFYPEPGAELGYALPIGSLLGKVRIRPAEVTGWTGNSGDGKTQILSHCTVDWVKQGSRICLASLEMKPGQTLKRMVKQVVGVGLPTREAIHAALRWLDRGLLLYDLTGKQKVDALLDAFAYARARYGCDQFVIDSLMRLGIAGDDYNAQENTIFRIVEWAMKHHVHVHLVAHSRKGDKERSVPETGDIKGAMELGANMANIISIWRNRKHEDAIKAEKDPVEKRKLEAKPGVLLNVAKQRNGDWEGRAALWFDPESYRYRSRHDDDRWRESYLPPDWSDDDAEAVA